MPAELLIECVTISTRAPAANFRNFRDRHFGHPQAKSSSSTFFKTKAENVSYRIVNEELQLKSTNSFLVI